MKRIAQAELVTIAKGKHLDAVVRWNPFAEAAKERQRAELREYLRVKIVMRQIRKPQARG